jgi:dTDP-L-rhamnose 4-epimerase
VASGYRSVVADVQYPQVHAADGWPEELAEEAERHPVGIASASQCDARLRLVKPDLVVHLAAETGTGQSLTEASRHGVVNVVGTETLLDALNRAGPVPDHFVLASACAVYGAGQSQSEDSQRFPAAPRTAEGGRQPVRFVSTARTSAGVTPCPHRADVTSARPSNVYTATKLAQEHQLQAWTAAMGARLSHLRLYDVYGAGQ